MARKHVVPDISTYHDALADLYVKMIPLDERKRRILANAGEAGLDVEMLDVEAHADATRIMTTPKKREPSEAPGFEGTPMGAYLEE